MSSHPFKDLGTVTRAVFAPKGPIAVRVVCRDDGEVVGIVREDPGRGAILSMRSARDQRARSSLPRWLTHLLDEPSLQDVYATGDSIGYCPRCDRRIDAPNEDLRRLLHEFRRTRRRQRLPA